MDSPLGAHVARVVDRADGQVALEPPERLFDLGELDVADPQLDRILAWKLGAWPIATLAAARLAQLLAISGEGEGVGPDAQAGLGPMQLGQANAGPRCCRRCGRCEIRRDPALLSPGMPANLSIVATRAEKTPKTRR